MHKAQRLYRYGSAEYNVITDVMIFLVIVDIHLIALLSIRYQSYWKIIRKKNNNKEHKTKHLIDEALEKI